MDLTAVDYLEVSRAARTARASRSSTISTRSATTTGCGSRCGSTRTTRGADRGRPVADRQLARARGVGHVRHPLRRPPRSPPAAHVRGVRRPPAAQGLPHQPAPAADRPQGSSSPWPRRPRGRSCWARAAAPAAARICRSAWARPIRPCTASSGSTPSSTARYIRKADVEIGYLHRAFEKDCEVGGYNNAIPYTDRLNYVSPLINNFAYASAVEKLLGIEVTERCKYIRTVDVGDLARLRPPDVRGRLGHGAGRLHGLPLHDQGARVPVGAGRGRDRRPADDLLRPGGRREGRPARRLRRQGRRRPSSRRARSSTRSTGC